MSYRLTYQQARRVYLDAYDERGSREYEVWIQSLGDDDHQACLDDLGRGFQFGSGMSVLDAGAGSGALCIVLSRIPGLEITALEPSPAMGDLLRAKPALNRVQVVEGFCDHPTDRDLFPANHFHVIASRQLANCLYDPISAFQNWHHWLRPGGSVVVLDGHYDRSAWSGKWSSVVDALPLSACQTMATVPYLMEQAGFQVDFVGWMDATNAQPSTRTKRYMVVAKKVG